MFSLLFAADTWRRQLEQDLVHTQRSAFAAGTVRNFKSQWNKFALFCQQMGDNVLPISTFDLCLYVQFLSRSLKSPQSILNYVHGLKTLHSMLEVPFPSLSSISVRLTIKGISKILSHIPQQAAPITPQLLLQIYNVLDVSLPLHSVIWTLFLFMFFLFARKSQFIPNSLKPADVCHLVLRNNVVRSESGLVVSFCWTKTHQSGGAPLLIPLVPVDNSPLCPVAAFHNMCRLVPAPSSSPLFVLPVSHGSGPIVYSHFHQVLRHCLSAIGVPSSGFSSHSFRCGGATFSFSVGVPGELIQSQGDWASDCYKLYLDLSMRHRLAVARSLSKCLQNV